MKRFFFLISLLVFVLRLPAAEPESRPIRVAVFQGNGVGPSCGNLLEVLGAAKGATALQVSRLDAESIRKGGLNMFDVLIHPGGSGGKQGNALEKEGREAVREFVRQGGGFIGICAGAYLATDDYEWSLGLIEAQVIDRKHWARGSLMRLLISDEL